MGWLLILGFIIFTTVDCRPFDVKWRIANLEKKQFNDIMDLRDAMDSVLETVNNKSCACINRCHDTSDQVENINSENMMDKLEENMPEQSMEAITRINRAFVEEKKFIRGYLEDLNKQENQMSKSLAELTEGVFSLKQTLMANQDNIERLSTTLNEMKWLDRGVLLLINQSTSWTCNYKSCYFIGQDATWEESKEACDKLGASFVEVESEEENQFLINLAVKKTAGLSDSGLYLGASDLQEEGTWRWATSQRTVLEVYTNFKGNEPNGKTRENCLHLYRQSNWKWNDISCTRRMGYICELKLS